MIDLRPRLSAFGIEVPERPFCSHTLNSDAWYDYAIAIERALLRACERLEALSKCDECGGAGVEQVLTGYVREEPIVDVRACQSCDGTGRKGA